MVFIDGCFWHGCPQHYVPPKSHVEYWEPKIAANRARDVETAGRLREQGWTVLRFWEHEDPQQVAAIVELAVRGHQSHAGSGNGAAEPTGEPPESSSWPR
jgi:DNA mismatch endonuclease (patch repair protein)